MPDDSVAINLDILNKHFNDGDVVTPENLIAKKIVSPAKGKVPVVKILAKGTLSKKLVFENCKVSKAGKEAIEKAGGVVK